MTENKARLQWLDIMKGILIFGVILVHSYPDLISERFFTPFFLSMFFWVSGYTFSLKDSFKNFIISRIRHFVIPLFILGGLRIMIISVLSGFDELPERILGLFLQRSCIYDEMWFLSCLFMVELIMYFLLRGFNHIEKQNVRYLALFLSGILFMAVGYLIIELTELKIPWELELAFLLVFYMICGYIWRKAGEKTGLLLKIPVVLICLAAYVALWLLVPNDVDLHAEKLGFFPLFFLESLIIIPVLVLVCMKLEGHIAGKLCSLFGQNSLFFFAFGGFGREIFYRVIDAVGLERSAWQAYACAIFTFALMIGPAVLFKRWFPFAIGVIRKKTEKNNC